jgi:hypothetical protein
MREDNGSDISKPVLEGQRTSSRAERAGQDRITAHFISAKTALAPVTGASGNSANGTFVSVCV